jgi:hypothetical protein
MTRLGLVVLFAGCGRLAFDPANGDVLGDGALGDAGFPLPGALVCSATRIPIDAPGGAVDLAVQSEGNVVVALWAPPGGTVTLLRIVGGVAGSPIPLATGPVDAIGGVGVAGSSTLFTTTRAGNQRLWHFDSVLTQVAEEAVLTADHGLPTDGTRSQFVWLRASGNDIQATYVSLAGVLGATGTITRSAPVTSLVGADNNDHVHMMWVEGTECRQADVDPLPVPSLGGNGMLASNCLEPRIDSGPPAADAIFTAWRSPAGAVETWYQGSVVNMGTRLSAAGRAPKVRFDGTRFWAVWIDTDAGESVQVAKVAQDLTFTKVTLAGWPIPSAEAFDLVKVGAIVQAAVILDDSLWMLTMCP